MTLPALTNWESTRTTLHLASRILGESRKAAGVRLPNHAHLTLEVTPRGLTTNKTDAGTLTLDYPDREITYVCPEGSVTKIPLAGHSQVSLAEEVLKALADHSHPLTLNYAEITDTNPLQPDAALAADYAAVQYSMFATIARFRARLIGYLSPVNVWPHGFDISTLWFARGTVEEQDPHLNIGFSPGSAGFPRPYIYVYARPQPAGFLDIKLPEPAYWTRDKWTGIVIDYDFLAKQADHERVLENMLDAIYAAGAPLL